MVLLYLYLTLPLHPLAVKYSYFLALFYFSDLYDVVSYMMLLGACTMDYLEQFQIVNCSNYTKSRQSRSQSNIYTCFVHHSTQPCSRQPF
jgi:hypothetical protein